ncbi:S8 family serine peptidase [Francisellaceae bacterium CB300]
MKKTGFTLLLSLACVGATYAGEYDLIVKYKDNIKNIKEQNKRLTSSFRGSTFNITKQLTENTFTVKVNDHQKNRQSDSEESKLNTAFVLADKLMKENPSIKYALPKGIKMYSTSIENTKQNNFSGNIEEGFWPIFWPIQWSMHGENSVHADDAWSFLKSKNLNETYVAVIDSGVSKNAPYDLMQKINIGDISNTTETYNFLADNLANRDISDDLFNHGTHVTGTIIANGPKVTSVAGKVKEIKVLPVKVLHNKTGDFFAIIESVKWLAGEDPEKLATRDSGTGKHLKPVGKKISVINASLGLPRAAHLEDAYWKTHVDVLCAAWKDAIDVASKNNTTVVLAAGNAAKTFRDSIPAACNNLDIIVTQASGKAGKRSYYSNYYDPSIQGNGYLTHRVVVTAPGGDAIADNGDTIFSTIGPNYKNNYAKYDHMQGTSMAAPHVSGIIALLYAYKPDTNFQKIKQLLDGNVDGVISAKAVLEKA